jgi:alpha-methylacyl-CoA racemase
MGPLAGLRVVEIGSIGPGPFAAMMLADMGADVLRLERKDEGGLSAGSWNLMNRGRRSVAVDLKHPDARELVLQLLEGADALIEGFRPGVMERLGLGPDAALARNPRLVYGRMTGYGQDGPMSGVAGHDINYIALSGALGAMARQGERPLFPLNLVGDFGGGGMLLAFGVVCALRETTASGLGQVVDAAMVEGAALLTTFIHALREAGSWTGTPGTNLLDSGAHFYEVYECADGGFVAVGAIEPQFYTELLRLLELPPEEFPQWDRTRWPELKERLAAVFRTRTRDEWAARFEHADACVTAVYGLFEASSHPHNAARSTFVAVDGITQPAPAPRFSRTAPAISSGPSEPGGDTRNALRAWGMGDDRIEALVDAGAVFER